MLEVAHDDRQKDFRAIDEVLDEEIDKLHRLSSAKTSITGTPSGFKDLDEITGGFQPGNLIIIAARPSMGKSALVTNIAENAVLGVGHPRRRAGRAVLPRDVRDRARPALRRLPGPIRGDELRKGRVPRSAGRRSSTPPAARDAPLWIDDSSDIGVLEMRAKARRLHQSARGRPRPDHHRLPPADAPEGRVESRVEQVGQMSRGLKILARELNVPVIALSQLCRAVESAPTSARCCRTFASRPDRAGRRPRDVHLPRGVLQQGVRAARARRTSSSPSTATDRSGRRADFQKEYPKFMNYAGERFAA